MITATENSLKIIVYNKCGTPEDCLVGTGTITFNGDPVSDTFASGLVSDILTINFTDDTRTRLKVVEVRTLSVNPAMPTVTTNTHTFHRRIVFPPGTLKP